MTRSRTRTVLVTGASAGLGRALVHRFAALGYDCVLVARRETTLRALAAGLTRRFGVRAHSIPCDLTRPGAPEILWATLEERRLQVDVLVNNAGTGIYGTLADTDPVDLRRQLTLNLEVPTVMTRLVLPAMLRRRWGRILNVASVAAFQPGGPRFSAYYASKAYLLSLSLGLARELRGTGVTASALCPGPMHTDFESRAEIASTVLYRYLPASSPDRVARAAVRGMLRGTTIITPGLLNKLLAFAGGLPPRALPLEVNRWLLHAAGRPACDAPTSGAPSDRRHPEAV